MNTTERKNPRTARASEQAAVSVPATAARATTIATAVADSGLLFVGIDASKVWQVVTRLVPGDGVKPAERMTVPTLLKRVSGWLKQGLTVHCVYETGPTGFDLARRLIELGASCLVVRAKRTERYGRRRKNDGLDSRLLAEDLAAHHLGRPGLLRPVRIPTVQEELNRLAVREREGLKKARAALLAGARGRALALGHVVSKSWWKPRVLAGLLPQLPPEIAGMFERTAAAAQAIATQLEAVEAQIIAHAPPAPHGVGRLTVGVVELEVCDWNRFKNGRRVGSFAGLCPCEDSTADRRFLGAIDKHGSPRLRFWCQELAWRLLRWQPGYHAVLWARERMRNANAHRIKQLSVALARRFLVDWWRIRTGRTTAEALGLTFKATG
jgi:transposase